jgi:hypothetical protein
VWVRAVFGWTQIHIQVYNFSGYESRSCTMPFMTLRSKKKVLLKKLSSLLGTGICEQKVITYQGVFYIFKKFCFAIKLLLVAKDTDQTKIVQTRPGSAILGKGFLIQKQDV